VRAPRLATATVLAVLAAVLGGATSAHADVKVPKALAGVELHEGATKVEVDRKVKRLGGRDVIVFRTRYQDERTVDEMTMTETATELAIVDAETRAYWFRERIQSTYELGDTAGTFEYRVAWEDESLVLTLGKTSGAGAPLPDARRVWQVRYGDLAEVGAEIVECPRAPDDPGELGGDEARWAPLRRAAVDRFVEAIDMGRKRAAVRCAYGDALVASRIAVTESMLPAAGHEWTAAPVASDCPGAEWAERHGVARRPRRVFVFTTATGLAIVAVRDGAVEEARVETFADHLGVDAFEPEARPVWSEVWIIDERLWFFAELELVDVHGEHGRFAIAFDPLGDWIAAKRVLAEGQRARLEHRTSEHGAFELIVSGGKNAGTIWSHEAATWRP
jgi:hypothetical protein